MQIIIKCDIIIIYVYILKWKDGDFMDISVGDVLIMKKQHPGCGSNRMNVLRVGADFKLSCAGCGRTFMIGRSKCEKSIKAVEHGENKT